MINLEKLPFLIDPIRKSRLLRRKFAKRSHPMFFLLYLAKYMTKPTAEFQREIFTLTEDKKLDFLVLTAFRGSAKSTICNTSLAIWSVVSGRANNIIIASQTRQQARQHLANIKKELETNDLLRNDLGPFEEESDEWGAFAITFKDYDARIMAVSTEQAIRGMRYKQYRPEIIILDDIEDVNSTRTREAREKIYNWFTSEIVPLGTPDTRIIVLGNFVHEYSLVGRLMAEIQSGQRLGMFKRYPLINDEGLCIWPGMYPNDAAIEAFRKKVGDEATWEREYKLNIIAAGEKLIPLEWIKFYEELPSRKKSRDYSYTSCAVDLAIGENETNDCTAIVCGQVHRPDGNLKVYILANPTNARLNFPKAIEAMKNTLNVLGEQGRTKMFIETVGFQEAYYQYMFENGYRQVEGVKVTTDKRTRLALTTKLIKEGVIVFAKTGCDELIQQLVGFGKEHHDDLADAFSMLIMQIMKEHEEGAGFRAWLKFCERNGGPWL